MIIAGIRHTGSGNINVSGGDIIFNTNRGVLSKGMSWWQHIYTVVIKATSTSIVTSYSGYTDAGNNTYSIYAIN